MVTLHDGRTVEILDIWFITHKMYLDFVADKLPEKANNELISKATGLTVDEIAQLPEKDYRMIEVAIVKKIVTADPI